jgi:DNA-binding SARP family transcriptional activator
MPALEISLLGPPAVRCGGHELLLAARKSAGLLYYLAAHPAHPLGRLSLIALLWDEHSEAEGRNNLSTALSRLRRALAGTPVFPIASLSDSLCWQPSPEVQTDIELFAQLTAGASPADDPASLEAAVALYRGPFLEGFEIRGSLDYEEWLVRERERWQQRVQTAYDGLVDLYRRGGRAADAIASARRALAIDPMREPMHRALMELYHEGGDRTSALAQFVACERALREGLDVGPSAETRALRDAIAAGHDPTALRRPGGPAAQPGRRPDPPESRPTPPYRAQYRLVGRDAEIERLRRQLDATPGRGGRLVVVEGQAGIGKTRLIEELLAQTARGASEEGRWTLLVGHGYQDAQGLPHHPLIEALRSQLSPATIDALDLPEIWLAEASRLLPEIAARRPLPPLPARLDPQQERNRLFESVARLIAALGRPRLLVLEDLHWADAETLHLLAYLVRHEGLRDTLVLATVRSEDALDGLEQTLTGLEYEGRLERIALAPLSATATMDLVREVARAAPAEFAARVYQESEGNALFAVELARSRVETGARLAAHGPPTLEPSALPATVQAVIRGRLARLDAASREFLNGAAVFRRAVDFDEARAVTGQDEEVALAASEMLLRAQILREAPQPLAAGIVVGHYTFGHEQFRRAVYEGLSDARRRLLHRRALELLAPAGEGRAEELAYHACRGQLWSAGLEWSDRAGAAAMRLFACAPAVHLYEQALTCAGQLPPTPELRRRTVDLRLQLATAGFYAHPGRLTEWLAPAEVEASQLGDTARLARVWLAQASAAYIQGRFTTALPPLGQLRQIAEESGDAALLARTDNVLGRLLVIRGELTSGLAALERALAATEPTDGREPVWPATALERLVSLGLMACAHAFRGEFTLASDCMERGQRLDDEARADASVRAAGAFYRALVAQTRGDWPATIELAEEAIAQARAATNLVYEYVSHVYLGLALARQGRVADGLAVQQAALGLAERAQTQVILGRAHAWLGEILLMLDRPEDAYAAAERGLALCEQHGYLLEAAMCARLRGEVCARLGAWAEGIEALEAARTSLADLEAWPEWARAEAALGRLLRARGDAAGALAHQERASRRFAAMGMEWDLGRSDAALASHA